MKAHEETLELRFNGGNACFTAESGEIVAYVRKPEWQSLLGAAPDMARELRHLVRLLEPKEREGGLDVPGIATLNGARAALKKAGVL